MPLHNRAFGRGVVVPDADGAVAASPIVVAAPINVTLVLGLILPFFFDTIGSGVDIFGQIPSEHVQPNVLAQKGLVFFHPVNCTNGYPNLHGELQ